MNRLQSKLTELKNIRELLQLLYNAAKEQRKVLEGYNRDTQN